MGKQWKQWQTLFWGAPKSLQMVIAAMFAYNYLVTRVDKVVGQMEARTMDFMDLLNEPERR